MSPDGEGVETVAVNGDALGYYCDSCGNFSLSGSLVAQLTAGGTLKLSHPERAALSRRLRLQNDIESEAQTLLTTYDVESLKNSNPTIPDPMTQITRLVREIGRHYLETGGGFRIDGITRARVGTSDAQQLIQLAKLAIETGMLLSGNYGSTQHPNGYFLTFAGWEHFHAMKRGKVSGTLGFMAMKFGDEVLEKFYSEVIKPAASDMGYELVDVRAVARAGIIDNIMRQQISDSDSDSDSDFVVVDLTHDNSGAYWEAGYAEGLGKPVIYICNDEKFAQKQTHFDTNHLTTVMWNVDRSQDFVKDFSATLGRSLNLY